MAKEMPLLKACDIEVRVQSVKKNKNGVGAVLLIYKDARVDMKILDEVYGQDNWQRTHEVIAGNLFCNIDIWDEVKQCWVRKQDVGVESNTEKQKGQASDAFKRAGFNVGIGRELYTAPFTYVPLNADEYNETGGKIQILSYVRFHVKEIGYDKDRIINKLIIVDNKGKVRFEMGKFTGTAKKEEKESKPYVIVDTDGTKLLLTQKGYIGIGVIEKEILIKMLASGFYEEARDEITDAINVSKK